MTIKIGIVTGASHFFILRQNELATKNLQQSDCKTVISKYRHTRGVELTDVDAEELNAANERVLLINCSQHGIPIRVQRYLDTFPEAARAKIATFRKREPWYRLDDGEVPTAFAPCLVRGRPRIVLNSAKLICTNNVLRLWLREEHKTLHAELLPLSLASTPGQVAAEIYGRACGSGGLKLEPSDWQQLRLLIPDAPSPSSLRIAFDQVDELLRSGLADAARKRADRFLMESIPSLRSNEGLFDTLELALSKLQMNRK